MSSNAEQPVLATQVTVVESEACHLCADARAGLAELALRYPLVVRTVDLRSTEGADLMRTHRASMSPLVLVDGVFFSHGRLPRHKLRRRLTERYGAPVALPSDPGGRHG